MESKGILESVINPFGKRQYTIRKTGEQVELIAFDQKENGMRSDEDWVSFIDSKGVEHIREHLTMQFDFKAEEEVQSMFDKLLFTQKESFDVWRTRKYDIVKDLVVKNDVAVSDATSKAEEIITDLKPSTEE